MKQFLAIFLLFTIGCNNAPEKEAEALKMSGAYKMTSLSVKNDQTDTTYSSLLQLKIFTDDLVMYANVNPSDSVSGFGIGSYTSNQDTVTENILYNANDTSKNDNPGSFKLIIEKSATGYKQVIPDMQWTDSTKMTLTENYESVGTSASSSIDGLWKQVKNYTVKGTDTSMNEMTQYKMYGAGHFMYGHSWADSTKKLHTGVGFGTFAMEGTNKIKESVTASTYSEQKGQNYDLAIEMTSTDEYKQTITSADGTKYVEFYQRVKK